MRVIVNVHLATLTDVKDLMSFLIDRSTNRKKKKKENTIFYQFPLEIRKCEKKEEKFNSTIIEIFVYSL